MTVDAAAIGSAAAAHLPARGARPWR